MPERVDPIPLRGWDIPSSDTPVAIFAEVDSPVGRELVQAESRVFPDVTPIFPVDDATFVMLGIVVDGEIHHVMRLSVTAASPREQLVFFVQDLVDSGQGLGEDLARSVYAHQGIDLDRVVTVETNSRLGDRRDGVSTADLAYLAVFDVVVRTRATAVFAHLNLAARKSFERVGLVAHPFADDPELRTPGAEPGTFDDEYRPTCLPVDDVNVGVFAALDSAAPQLLWAPEAPGWWTPVG